MKLSWEEWQTLENGQKKMIRMTADSDKLLYEIDRTIEKAEVFRLAFQDSMEQLKYWQEHDVPILGERDYQVLLEQERMIGDVLKVLHEVCGSAAEKIAEGFATEEYPGYGTEFNFESSLLNDIDPFA